MGIVPMFILFNEDSINAFLDLALDFFNLFLWSGVVTRSRGGPATGRCGDTHR